MQIEQILHEVILHTRKNIPLGVVNKCYPNKALLPQSKREKHSVEMDSKRFWANLNQALFGGTTEDDFHNKIHWFRNNQISTGSCEDYTAVAYIQLMVKCRDIVRTFGPMVDVLSVQVGDHEFIMVNPPSYSNLEEKILPPITANYPPDTWICDPWANIVCPARSLPIVWKNKMTKWARRGKFVSQAGNFVNPLAPKLYNILELNEVRANVGADGKSFLELSGPLMSTSDIYGLTNELLI